MPPEDHAAWEFGRDPCVQVLGPGRAPATGRGVLYWMQNSQRAEDNGALDLALRLANERGVGLTAYIALDERVPHASDRTFSFLLEGRRGT